MNMNFFNKTLLAIALAFALQLSMQANWLSDLKDSALAKKKTITSGLVLGGLTSYLSLKLMHYRYLAPSFLDYPGNEHLARQREVAGLDPKVTRNVQIKYISCALGITAGLIYVAHKLNLFGENSKNAKN